MTEDNEGELSREPTWAVGLAVRLRGGQATSFGVSVEKVVMGGGNAITLSPGSVTAIVGGNNTGKSTLLRQIARWLHGSSQHDGEPVQLVQSLSLHRTGTSADFLDWVGARYPYSTAPMRDSNGKSGFVVSGQGFNPEEMADWWVRDRARLGPASNVLVYFAGADSR